VKGLFSFKRVRLNRQALVMLNGWMASRHHHRRHGNEDASPANELARALTCIRRDDVVNAYLDDVITTCVRRDSATYADRGSTSAVFPLLGRIAFSGVTKGKGAQGEGQLPRGAAGDGGSKTTSPKYFITTEHKSEYDKV